MENSKKLLLLGKSNDTKEVLEYCKKTGVYTIITDYNTPDQAPIKLEADEYWMIDVADLDQLEKKCREVGVTNVYAGNIEFCLDQTKALAGRLGMPFYASEAGWKATRDKAFFKNECMKAGLDIPKQYYFDQDVSIDQLNEVSYPVVAKPVDRCAQIGFSLCHNPEELLQGIKKAYELSFTKKIVVEEYIQGEELNVMFFLDHGKVLFNGIISGYCVNVNGRNNFSFDPDEDKYLGEYDNQMAENISHFFENLDCRNGEAYFQIIRRDGKWYFLEFIYRLNGVGLWGFTKHTRDYNAVEMMVDLALDRKSDMSWAEENKRMNPKGIGALYFYWANPGHVSKICGLEALKEMNGIDIILQRFKEGDTILQTDNMYQIPFYISLYGKDKPDLLNKLKFINDNLMICDENGNNLMIPFVDYESV